VAIELIGLPATMEQAFKSLSIQGRAGYRRDYGAHLLKSRPTKTDQQGGGDHRRFGSLAQEIPQLIEWVRQGGARPVEGDHPHGAARSRMKSTRF